MKYSADYAFYKEGERQDYMGDNIVITLDIKAKPNGTYEIKGKN